MTPQQQLKHFLKRVRDLHALYCGGSTPEERESAWRKLDAHLKKHNKTWNDVPELLAKSNPAPAPSWDDPRDAQPPDDYSNVTPADLVRRVLGLYVALEPHELDAVTLWILHTHVFNRFMVTPRLALISPVKSCGKTTLLDVCSVLVARAEKSDNISAAALYFAVDHDRRCMLLDEFDQMEMATKAVVRAMLHSGHRRGGTITRVVRGERYKYQTFAPVALAAIGAGSLSRPLLDRSIIINMKRYAGKEPLRRFDGNDTAELDAVYRILFNWAQQVKLNSDPKLPPELRLRPADNWRPLVAVADSCSREWGRIARNAAIAFICGGDDEDPSVAMLRDIRAIYDELGAEQLPSQTLVESLNGLDDAPWCEWRGPTGTRPPRRLSPSELARLLAPFGIRSRVLWPTPRKPKSSFRGYRREWFEIAWHSYCGGDETSQKSQPHLRIV